MKKLILGLLAVFLIAGMAVAYPATSGEVTDTPAAGLFKTHLSSTDVLGATCQIGANTFKYVRNLSTEEVFQGEPVFHTVASADGYSVDAYESSDMFEHLAGIAYCNKWGGTTIHVTTEVATASTEAHSIDFWIVEKGVARAQVSGEGTDIDVGDVLTGYINVVPTNNDHLQYLRDFATSNTATVPSSYEANYVWSPVALEAKASSAPVGLIKVWLR